VQLKTAALTYQARSLRLMDMRTGMTNELSDLYGRTVGLC